MSHCLHQGSSLTEFAAPRISFRRVLRDLEQCVGRILTAMGLAHIPIRHRRTCERRDRARYRRPNVGGKGTQDVSRSPRIEGLGHEVPHGLYAAVAVVLRYAFRLAGKRGYHDAPPPGDLPIPNELRFD